MMFVYVTNQLVDHLHVDLNYPVFYIHLVHHVHVNVHHVEVVNHVHMVYDISP